MLLATQALMLWENHFFQIMNISQGVITTKTAADIASSLATQLLSPIAAQIDPLRLGEIQRSINIARKYGESLGASADTINRLIYSYPSHGFAIDIDEAIELFKHVRPPTPKELALEYILHDQMVTQYGEECMWSPHSVGVIVCLTKNTASEDKQKEENNEADGETNQSKN